ncbi:MAG: hypothetical protein SFY70_05460 [Bacteroidia bacterium]|nr:hypothetical protein [Bacteroidia bacterium]
MKEDSVGKVDVGHLEKEAHALNLKANDIENETVGWRNGAFGVLIVGALVFVSAIVVYLSGPNSKDLGAFLLGAAGTLWSGSGLVLIYVAFLGQKQQVLLQRAELIQNRRQLELQRQELEDTREELKGQKEQLALQVQTSQIQLFESTFFKMHSRLLELKHRLMFIQHSETYQQPLMKKPFIMQFVDLVLGNYNIKNPSGASGMFGENFDKHSRNIDLLALGSYLEQLKYLIYHIRTVEKDIDTKFYYNYIKSDLSIREKIFLNLYKDSLMTGEFKVTDNEFNAIFGVTENNLISIFGSEGSKVVYEYLINIPVAERSA